MSILSGYGKYKRYILSDNGYKLCSQWTSSNTVHFDDGKTAQNKVGAINGITDSLTATNSNVALSSKAGNSLQSQINQLNTDLTATVRCTHTLWSKELIVTHHSNGMVLVMINLGAVFSIWNNANELIVTPMTSSSDTKHVSFERITNRQFKILTEMNATISVWHT